MSDKNKPSGGLLARARRASKLVQLARQDRQRPDRKIGLSARVTRQLSQAVARRVTSRLVDLADLMSSRLLAMDAVASELAALVEDIRSRHGVVPVLTATVRHNLLLDGTFLRLLEPSLRLGDPPQSLDADTVDRGRRSVANMLVELFALDGDGSVRPEDLDDQEVLQWLASRGLPARCPGLWQWLQGCADAADDARFLFGSYLVFLHTLTLRMGAHAMREGSAIAALPRSDDDTT